MTYLLKIDNSDLPPDELAEIFTEALDGYLPLDDSKPIGVLVEAFDLRERMEAAIAEAVNKVYGPYTVDYGMPR